MTKQTFKWSSLKILGCWVISWMIAALTTFVRFSFPSNECNMVSVQSSFGLSYEHQPINVVNQICSLISMEINFVLLTILWFALTRKSLRNVLNNRYMGMTKKWYILALIGLAGQFIVYVIVGLVMSYISDISRSSFWSNGFFRILAYEIVLMIAAHIRIARSIREKAVKQVAEVI